MFKSQAERTVGFIQIPAAIHLLVQWRDGSRKVTSITEVQGMEGETIVMQELFRFVKEGERDGRIGGSPKPCGMGPRFEPRLKAHGFTLSASTLMKSGRGVGQWSR